jgi:hypothetical protein
MQFSQTFCHFSSLRVSRETTPLARSRRHNDAVRIHLSEMCCQDERRAEVTHDYAYSITSVESPGLIFGERTLSPCTSDVLY